MGVTNDVSITVRQWLVACSAPSHELNQCWLIVNWTLRNKLQWDLNQNTSFSFMKMALKMSSAKWRPKSFHIWPSEAKDIQFAYELKTNFLHRLQLRVVTAINANRWGEKATKRLQKFMKTSSNGKFFRVTGYLCGEFTGPRWTPRTKASDAELCCFLWSASE